MHLKELSLTNFRTFKNIENFELAPITIFCGENNSGKSSVLKALLLLKNSFEKTQLSELYFKGGDHNLGSFKNTVNNRSDIEEITFSIKAGFFSVFKQRLHNSEAGKYEQLVSFSHWSDFDESSYLFYDENVEAEKNAKIIQKFEMTFTENAIVNLKLIDQNGKMVFKSVLKSTRQEGEIFLPRSIIRKEFFLSLLKNYPNETVDACAEEIVDFIYNKLTKFNQLQLNLPNYDPQNYVKMQFSFSYLLYFNCIKLLDLKEYKDYNPFFGIQEDMDEDFDHSDSGYTESGSQFNSLTLNLIADINKYFDNYGFDIALDESISRREFIDVKLINDNFHELSGLQMALTDIDYLPVLRSTQERLYTFKSQGSVYNNILDEFKIQLTQEDQEWVNSKLMNFNIAEKVSIRLEPEIGYWVKIENNGKEYSPVDIGFGFSQLFPILMKIIMNKKGILIIEEPEANLHPKLQSLLANMFVEAFKRFNVQFLIESHSEYLIRKLQYLTAAKQIPTNFTSIHYIESEPDADPKAYKIDILKDGGLSRNFGEGFFDEATNIQFELLKLKQSQLN